MIRSEGRIRRDTFVHSSRLFLQTMDLRPGANKRRAPHYLPPLIHSPKCITSLLRTLYVCTYLLLHYTFVYIHARDLDAADYAQASALYMDIFIMNTLSINKIIEFYIHRVTCCVLVFIHRCAHRVKMMRGTTFAEFDSNTHWRIHRVLEKKETRRH